MNLSSMVMSLLEKSAPIVDLYCGRNLFSMNRCINDVFPTLSEGCCIKEEQGEKIPGVADKDDLDKGFLFGGHSMGSYYDNCIYLSLS